MKGWCVTTVLKMCMFCTKNEKNERLFKDF